ncbi:MAG: TonB-dependent receptor [Saprospiraceae bacterium]
MYKNIIFLLVLFLFAVSANAQNFIQNLKGTVYDKAVKTPLVGATVVLLSAEQPTGTTTDPDGRFRLPSLPVGKHTLRITCLGYKEGVVSNITLNSGKEMELTIELEEDLVTMQEVVVRAKIDKQKPLNELAAVSARTFSVEETQRFAAAVNDPGRMVSAFAGVATANDGNNTIVIRGNAPNGLLWRMEGVDIPNPNHFSAVGTSGGGISILSTQLLSNSDFMTGAFAAEYGNALSGVFDMKLRKGNSEKREYTLQAGLLGLDAAAEGPMRFGKQNGSFLVNYRYSTLSLLGKLGVSLGDAKTDFQDLSFNLWMPAGKIGQFTLFGIGGLSKQHYEGKADSSVWQNDSGARHNWNYTANTGVLGLTHRMVLGDNTFLRNVVAVSGTRNGFQNEKYQPDYNLRRLFDGGYDQVKTTVSTTLTHKLNARNLLRTGMYVNFYDYNFRQNEWDDEAEHLVEQIKNNGAATSANAFAQWQHRPSERLTLNAGAHVLYFFLNNTYSVEPRAAVKYAFNDRQTISLGYGLHGQLQPPGVYFVQDENGAQPNRNLGPSRAHHLVLSYDHSLPGNWHLKPELYYQDLFDVPVSRDERNAFSMLNQRDGFAGEILANKGKGRNYGVELTAEKFLTDGFYFLLSSSLFRSEYRGSDEEWRNTRFNTGFINSLVAGKEWNWNRGRKNRTFGLNMKLTWMGGQYDTPIDLAASNEKGKTIHDESRAFSEQLPAYFRLDLGIKIKRNYEHLTTTLSLDIQNASNRANYFGRYYDDMSQTIKFWDQTPLIPVLNYRVEF